ncbi:MAG TPA: hypothetical protein VJ063_14685, partial [Verrucomicrobiae bacterium]|nr:hypothetical protein [Verrucomicrobiae bacterium]
NAAADLSRLEAVPPCAALKAAAQAKNIPLEQIDPVTDEDRLDPGDSIGALITVFEKGHRKQWLVYLEVVAPTPEESAHKPAPPMVLYSSFGGTQTCVSAPAFVVVRTLGPFADGTKPGKAPEKSARFELNKGYLSLGLHHAAAAFQTLEQGTMRGTWFCKQTPFTEAQVAKGRELAARLQLSPESERAMIGAVPAMLSYFEVVRNSPGLSDIFFEVVDLPSAWSLVRNLGIRSVSLRFDKGAGHSSPGLWGLPDFTSVNHFPMVLDLNERRALKLRFVVTSPNPPLLPCAGVIGMLAEHPGDKEKYLTLRIVSARRFALRKT